MSGNQDGEERISCQSESSSCHRPDYSDVGGEEGGGGAAAAAPPPAVGHSSHSSQPLLNSNQSSEKMVNAEDEPPSQNQVSTVSDASAGLCPATPNGAASLDDSESHVLPPAHETPDAPTTMLSEELANMEVNGETEEIPNPVDAVNCGREGKGKEKVIDVPSEDDELEIIGVKESVASLVTKPKKTPVVPCVAWRTRLSRGKQERVSYSTYFQKISDDSGDEKDDDKRDKDAVVEEEEEVEESSGSDEESDKSRPDIDVDDDVLIGDWQERIRAVKRKIMESDEEREETGLLGSELDDDFMSGPPMKKLKPDNPDEVHVIESDLETDLDSDRGVLRSASSDSDWEEEIRYVPPSAGGGSSSSGFGRTSSTYRLKTPASKIFPRPYRQSVKKDRSGSRSRSHKRYKKRSGTKGRVARGQDLMRMLVDRMCGDKGSGNWKVDPNQYELKDVLPMVFCFEEELEERKKERTEEDRELDALWADYEFALESENIGRYHSDEGLHVDEGAIWDPTSGLDGYCPNGQHDLILDEQIGVVCKNCPFVSVEIRYILPAMATSMVDKSAWRVSTSEPKAQLQYTNLCANEEFSEPKPCDNTLDGTVWDLIPGIFSTMYAHQREAIEFMWNNLAGGIELDCLRGGPRTDVIGGCVVCHAPGTGKTRLAIVFIQTYMKVFPNCRPVIIAPRGMLYTWEEEFKKWNINIPFHILNTGEYTGKEDSALRKLVRNETRTEKLTRLVKLCSWDKGNGVLGVSYGLFKMLTPDRCKNEEDAKVRTVLLEKPGLLVLDEGHTPRNERSIIWKTLGKVKSEKRIILSGTPFQNNFLELYNILCLVRPQFAERFLIKRPRKRGRHRTLDPNEAKEIWNSITSNVIGDNAEEVRAILKPFVHTHTGNILQMLPGLRECVIILSPSSYQKDVIKKVESIGTGCNFENEYKISLASIHPSLVTALKMTEEEAAFIDKQQLDTYRSNPNEGVKTKFVMEVVRLCEALKEKVLIFSQFIEPLSLIKAHLIKLFQWREGKEILQMDGKILPKYRQTSIDIFNDRDSDAKVLLASTRACCEGISLTGASRVVLLDVVWNPAVGRQAISRAYRIGQRKFVYTYNLITSGTSEVEKYDRQAEKDHLSKLVFAPETDLNNVRNTLTKSEEKQSSKLVAQDKILATMTSHRELQDMFFKIYYPPTDANVVYTYNQIAPP